MRSVLFTGFKATATTPKIVQVRVCGVYCCKLVIEIAMNMRDAIHTFQTRE